MIGKTCWSIFASTGSYRPVKRKTLESHIGCLLGGRIAPKAVRELIAALEQDGVIRFNDNKIVEYKIPKRKK